MSNATVLFGSVALLLLTISLQTQHVESANILGLFPSHSPSHLIVHMSVAKALAEKGHNITVVSGLKPKVTHPSITHIIIPPSPEEEKEFDDVVSNIATKNNNLFNTIIMMTNTMKTSMNMQYNILKDERMLALYDQKDTKFDLVIYGYFFNEFALGVAAKLNVPVIVDWPAGPMDFVNKFVGNPLEVSYVPDMKIGVKPGEVMTFVQRIQNTIGTTVFKTISYVLHNQYEEYYEKLFPGENFPSLNDMQKNVSLVFTNSHFSEGPIRPNVPALVEIGGIQVKEKPNSLPKDIADHLNTAQQHGAILFCLGSNVKSAHVKPETVAKIFRVLSGLKQNVVWKWDDLDNLPGKSANILYIKWLPQDDILAHPNLKLFITHAGKGGLAESQYHAIPMVALPLFADQDGNAQRMVASGYGKQLSLRTLDETEFKNAVTEVLTNPIYKENVAKFSKLYRDRPMTAKQSVVYWTEYVLRHHGATHMQSPLVYMNGLQAMNLDVLGVIAGALVLILSILFYSLKFCCGKCFKSKKGNKKLKKK